MRRIVLAIACAGCGSFGEPPPDSSAPTPTPTPTAVSAPAPAPPAATGPSTPASPERIVFTDDFNRDPNDVMGLWSNEVGTLTLVPQPSGGSVFRGLADSTTPH